MPVSVFCPSCGANLKAPDAAAGRSLKCPKCAAPVPVPVAELPPAQSALAVPEPPSGPALRPVERGPVRVPAEPRRRDERGDRHRRRHDDAEDVPRTAGHGTSAFATMFGGSMGCLAAAGVVGAIVAVGCAGLMVWGVAAFRQEKPPAGPAVAAVGQEQPREQAAKPAAPPEPPAAKQPVTPDRLARVVPKTTAPVPPAVPVTPPAVVRPTEPAKPKEPMVAKPPAAPPPPAPPAPPVLSDDEIAGLAKGLKAKDYKARLAAVEEIGSKGPPAAATATDLCAAMLDSNQRVASAALQALEKVSPDLYRPVSTHLLDQNANQRAKALRDIREMGARAKPFTPVLLARLKASVIQGVGGDEYLEALQAVEADDAATVEFMTRLAAPRTTVPALRGPALIFLGNWAAGDEERGRKVLPFVRDGIVPNGPVLKTAVKVAGDLGPAARELLPVLRQAKLADDGELRKLATAAVANIEKSGPP